MTLPHATLLRALPKAKGSYALRLRLPICTPLQIGSLGSLEFPAGDYVYLGSALGPGGLRGRLGRHLRLIRKTHWHIDYLREPAHLVEVSFEIATAADPGEERLECRWSQALGSVPEIHIPMLAFGASDCRSGCVAHLVALPVRSSKSLQDWFRAAGIRTHSMCFLPLNAV